MLQRLRRLGCRLAKKVRAVVVTPKVVITPSTTTNATKRAAPAIIIWRVCGHCCGLSKRLRCRRPTKEGIIPVISTEVIVLLRRRGLLQLSLLRWLVLLLHLLLLMLW